MNAGISAEALAVLQQLAQLGELKPETVVAHAASPDSPLHEAFTWDDAEAGHRWRLEEARTLIRSVRVEVVVNEITLSAPRYTHDPGVGRNAGYVEVLALRGDETRARAVVQQELQRVVSALERANRVAASLGLEAEMRELIERATSMREDIADAMHADAAE